MMKIGLLAGLTLLSSFNWANANCSPSTVKGAYSFTVHGLALSPDGTQTTAMLDGVGTIVFDGAGNITQEDFVVRNGSEVPGGPPNPSGFHTGETGSYTLDSDCTGVISIDLGSGNTRTESIVVSKRGSAIHGIVSSATQGGSPLVLQVYADFESMTDK
jgi:hypothetical protein